MVGNSAELFRIVLPELSMTDSSPKPVPEHEDDVPDGFLTRPSLILRARGDEESPAWEELLSYYEPFVSMVLQRMGFRGEDLEDLRQQVFVKLWNGLEKYEKRDAVRFRSWLSSLIRNAATDWMRRHAKTEKSLSLDEPGAMEQLKLGNVPEVEEQIEEEWRNYLVKVAMERIKEVFTGNAFEVFALTLEGKSVEEISSELGLRTDSIYVLRNRVKGRLQREIQQLRHDLEVGDE